MMCNADKAILNEKFIFDKASDLPISFLYDGIRDTLINGIPSDFVTSIKTVPGEKTRKIIFCGKNKDDLKISFECTIYEDFPVCEYVAYMTNESESESKLITNFRIFDSFIEGTEPEITYGTGDTTDTRGYEMIKEELISRLRLSPADGTGANGASPFVRLMFKEFGMNIAIGWPGQWFMEIKPCNNERHGAQITLGQKRCKMKLLPGETIRTPSLTIMTFKGDESRGINLWRRWFREYIMPKPNGKKLSPMSVHGAQGKKPFEWAEWAGATESQQIEDLQRFLDAGMKPDLWWFDAGWYPCELRWPKTGTWLPNPQNFPNGFGKLGEKCKEAGSKFLLWFEPERVRPDTELWNEHPEWILMPSACDWEGNGLLNYAIPECVDWITERIDSIIKEGKITVYRQDFNFDPMPFWINYEEEGRMGALENAHIQGYLRFWDSLVERNPGLLIDTCASGGRRNEMEALRRSVPLHFTDVGYGIHPVKQKQYRMLNEWTPYYRSHNIDWRDEDGVYADYCKNMPFNRFSLYNALAPAVQVCIAPNASDDKKAILNEFMPKWRRAAQIMLDGDFYPLTKCRKSTKDFYVMQFELPKEKVGFFHIISNINNPDEECIVHPHFPEGTMPCFETENIVCDVELKNDKSLAIKIGKGEAEIVFYKY